MNDETLALLLDVTERLERSIAARDCPAIVVLDGRPRLAMSDYDYLRDRETAVDFELRAAGKARETGAARWAFAVPQVWVMTEPGEISFRAVSNHPLREGEREAIAWTSFDLGDGIYGLVQYEREPDGNPVFGQPEVFNIDIHVTALMPGYGLLQAFLDAADTDEL